MSRHSRAWSLGDTHKAQTMQSQTWKRSISWLVRHCVHLSWALIARGPAAGPRAANLFNGDAHADRRANAGLITLSPGLGTYWKHEFASLLHEGATHLIAAVAIVVMLPISEVSPMGVSREYPFQTSTAHRLQTRECFIHAQPWLEAICLFNVVEKMPFQVSLLSLRESSNASAITPRSTRTYFLPTRF